MTNTISMHDLMHLNLFGNITGVKTRYCFDYNNAIFFCVPKELLRRAVGENASNIKRLNDTLHKRTRIVAFPDSNKDIKYFFEKITEPVTFKELNITDNEIIITAGSMSKASLIGRNKRRLFELQKIAKEFFSKELKIV